MAENVSENRGILFCYGMKIVVYYDFVADFNLRFRKRFDAARAVILYAVNVAVKFFDAYCFSFHVVLLLFAGGGRLGGGVI